MLTNKHPEQNLETTTPLTHHAVESLEATPFDNSVKSDATLSSESTVKADDRDDNIGSDSSARGTDEDDMTTLDSGGTDINATLVHLGLFASENIDPESLTRLGLHFIDNEDTEDDEEKATNIAQWNCHECCKINEIEAENPQTWADVGSDYCTNIDCRHTRCYDCYYLDSNWEPLEYCDGRPVDEDEYQDWYNSFERV